MGYRPNPAAAALAHCKKTSSTPPIQSGLAWLNLWADPKALRRQKEFDYYWQGALAAAQQLGYNLEEFNDDDTTSPERIERILYHRGITGILIPPHYPQPEWGNFQWDRFSVVRFGRSVQTPRVHLVTADQVENTILAFEKIRARGYERVGFVGGGGVGQIRIHFFEAGYMHAQREVHPSLRLPVFRINNGSRTQAEFERWLKANKPDAIFTDSVETPYMLKKAGYKVPDDIGLAVSSVFDIEADAGIDQQPKEIGKVGLLMVASLVSTNDRGVPPIFRQSLIEGRWVDGSTLPQR